MKRHSALLSMTLSTALLIGCGGDDPDPGSSSSSESSSSVPTADNQVLSLAGGASNFTVPDADLPFISQPASVPLARELTDAQQLMNASSVMYPLWHLADYQQLLPHPELFCSESTDAEFLALADQLGGFKKGSYIRIEPDATAPQVQSGLMQNDYLLRFAPAADAANSAGGGGAVTIQRPDIVGTSGTKAFYLSDTYGLITVDYSNVPFAAPSVSCAAAMPGTPKNFVITEQYLYAMTTSAMGYGAAVLQFDIGGSEPTFVSGTYFDNQSILDARLFNDTLALYMQTYEEPEDNTDPTPADTTTIGNGFADIRQPYPYRRTLGYELKILATKPIIAEQSREALVGDGVENPPQNTAEEIEAIHRYSHFNSFLSASGEYLVVTESVTERHFDGYEQRSYYRCNEYETHEYPYQHCQTKWKRVENPDYVEPSSPGIVECEGDLLSCLKQQLPTVNRYVYVNDGQECFDRIRYRYTCLAGETITSEYPTYSYQYKTKFSVFHFENGTFVRLDDQLASLDGSDIVIEERPFEVQGRVQKHDHIQFYGDYLYVISGGNWSNKESRLTTLAIMGNSAMEASSQTLAFSSGEINTAYSNDYIYISTNANRNSNITTMSLADPLHPRLQNTVSFASALQQLMYTDDGFVGLGTASVQWADRNYSVGSVTTFSPTGEEQDSVLLGADYRYYYSPINYDDQVLSFSAQWQRLILPYNVSNPHPGVDGPRYANRLSILKNNNDEIVEEATFNLPEQVERSAQLDNDNALAFSPSYIHYLNNDGDWQTQTVFDGAIPQSIYYSREYPTQVQYFVVGNERQFHLIDSPDKASGTLLDSQTVTRAGNSVCLSEQVLFDRDRVLVVREKPGQYISYEDCPSDRRRETEKEFIGFRITADHLEPILDQAELEQLYIQAGWNLICVTDMNNTEGEILDGYTLDDVEDLSCFTYEQFLQQVIPEDFAF